MKPVLSEADVWQILKETGAYLEGHFLMTTGRHTAQFMLCSQVMQYPPEMQKLCEAIAAPFRDERIDVVVGPAMGGVLLAYEVARALGVRSIYTEKMEDGTMGLRRGFRLQPGERVLVVEDAVSTGSSVFKCLDALRPHQPEIVGVGVLVDRSGGTVDFGVPFRPVLRTTVEHWQPAECPLCAKGVPLAAPKK